MNKVTRMLVMAGLALAAGATMGAGPAAASTSSPATPSATTSTATSAGHRIQHSRSRVIGFYRDPVSCHRVGRIGEFRDRWDDHDCLRVRGGFHRGWWMLVARWDRPSFPGHGGPGGWNGPGGHIRPGGWDGQGGHDRPGGWNGPGGHDRPGNDGPGGGWNHRR